MAWRVDDRLLWIGLGVFTFAATKAIGYALRDTLRLTQIHEEQQAKQLCQISQETEDALDTRSLAVLASSHDRQIRDSATRILADRFVRSSALLTNLAADLYSPDNNRRTRARNLLTLLENSASDQRALDWLQESAPSPNAIVLDDMPGTAYAVNRQTGEWARVVDGNLIVPSARDTNQSPEELELRRRRREAIVLHEGEGAITREDIIQRRPTGGAGHDGGRVSPATTWADIVAPRLGAPSPEDRSRITESRPLVIINAPGDVSEETGEAPRPRSRGVPDYTMEDLLDQMVEGNDDAP